MNRLITQSQLEIIDRQLGERDKAILHSILLCRYIMSKQIQRLHFTDSVNQSAALRVTQRVLVRLKSCDLIEHLERRIGGVRSGSGSYVWALTDKGYRLLHLNEDNNRSRKRFYEPSPAFLEHTLAIAETYLQLIETCRNNKMELIKTEFEPKCWRGYTDIDSKPATLKPDLFAITASGDYEDFWFIEVDLSTEAPGKILDKCNASHNFQQSLL